jgi:hypothetical protein
MSAPRLGGIEGGPLEGGKLVNCWLRCEPANQSHGDHDIFLLRRGYKEFVTQKKVKKTCLL